ncbi:MAG: peptidase M13 [Promicromonosporaceae bacterium]|nr:peptidase M13 [Promicromonosporaceae bacterium]
MTRPSGIDLTALDPATRPQDDLYRHVNGRWLATHEIPADRPLDGSFMQLRDLSEERVRAIIEDLGAQAAAAPAGGGPASTAAKIGALYASFMDEDSIADKGTSPIRPMLDAIEAIETREDLVTVIGDLARSGDVTTVGIGIEADLLDPSQYAVYLMQAGLGLPDEAYYREDDYAEIRAEYVTHIARMLALAGFPHDGSPHEAAEQVMALETKLAGFHWDVVKSREIDQMYNPTSLEQLMVEAPGFDWPAFADRIGLTDAAKGKLIACQPSYLTGVAALGMSEPIDAWKFWAAFHLISSYAPYLSDQFVEANFAFYGRVLSGTQEVRERWKRGVALVEGVLGEAVGEQYVARHFPPDYKAKMDALVTKLTEAYRESIESLDWMSAETKVKALDKLAKFTPKIGYPSKWRDYAGLDIAADDLVGNVRRAAIFEADHEIAKVGRPMDREEWHMTPQTVNAYYNPPMNEIVFPAAILQPPFFDPEADDAVNYGGIGGVIGHEIGHGFDDQGSKFDGDGVMQDWWTAADRAEFEARTKALIAQYDALVPAQLGPDGMHVNGSLTIGENIGDLGGLSIAIKAYALALGEQGIDSLDAAPVIDGLTGLERVFLGWAQVWQQKTRDEMVIQRLSTDPHSPNEFRCNQVLKNVDEFHATYRTQEGDGLWLAPEDRVRIW